MRNAGGIMSRKLAVMPQHEGPGTPVGEQPGSDDGANPPAPGDDGIDDEDGDDPEDGDDEDDDPDGAEDLRDAGKKALDRMKDNLKQEKRQRREAQAELERLRQERDTEGKTPDEQALEAARAEARAEATTRANQRILRSEVRAAAAGKFKDPSDALAFLDLTEFEVDDDGEVDADELSDALDDLLQRKPHLAAQSGPTSFDSARGKPKPNKKLTREDLKKMSPEQIDKAHREGRIEA